MLATATTTATNAAAVLTALASPAMTGGNPLVPWHAGILLVGVLFWLAIAALATWVLYLVVRTAVKNGILRADAARANRHSTP